MHVCVCVCVSERDREREREKGHEELDAESKKLKAEELQASTKFPRRTEKMDDILLQLSNTVYENTIEKWTNGCILFFPKGDDIGIN